MQITFKSYIENLFKQNKKFSDSEGNLYISTILQSIEKIDKELIKLLLQDSTAKEKFFVKVEDVYVLEQNKLIEFFMQKDYMQNNSYTAYTNKIGLIKKDSFIKKFDDVVLAWPHKDCILEGGQTKDEQKKQETFYNEILSSDEIDRLFEPKVLTNIKRYTKDGIEPNPTIQDDDNLIIKGNNLIALHSLKKKFAGKVKLIYIDPPYNTGNDSFKYNDNFNHSTWLTFMKNRLEVAREFLSDDGVIFVQIDDNEQAYLKVLMDEVFDVEEVTLFIQVRYEGKSLAEKNNYQKLIEHIFVYSKGGFQPNKDEEAYTTEKFCWEIKELTKGKKITLGGRSVTLFKKGEYELKKIEGLITGLKETWASGTVLKNNASGKYFNDYIAPRVSIDGLGVLYKVDGIGEDGLGYRYFTGPKREGATKGKFYSGIPLIRKEEIKDGKAIKYKSIANFYNFADAFGNCRLEGGVELRSGKKPEVLLKRIIEISTKPNDLVMDFHLGSGTTCAVAHKMGRRYIGIEQMNYYDNDSIVRLNNVINGDKTGVSKALNWKGGGSFVYAELKIIEHFKDVEIGALNKNMQYLPISEIEDKTYNISDEEIAINKAFYGVDDE